MTLFIMRNIFEHVVDTVSDIFDYPSGACELVAYYISPNLRFDYVCGNYDFSAIDGRGFRYLLPPSFDFFG